MNTSKLSPATSWGLGVGAKVGREQGPNPGCSPLLLCDLRQASAPLCLLFPHVSCGEALCPLWESMFRVRRGNCPAEAGSMNCLAGPVPRLSKEQWEQGGLSVSGPEGGAQTGLVLGWRQIGRQRGGRRGGWVPLGRERKECEEREARRQGCVQPDRPRPAKAGGWG